MFFVADIIVLFSWGQFPWEEVHRVQFWFITKTLNQYSTDPCVWCIHLHHEQFFRVWVVENKHWCECTIKIFECCFSYGVPGQLFGPFLEEECSRCSNATETSYEALLKSGEHKEILQVFDSLWSGPACDSCYLGGVHGDSLRTNDVLQEGNGGDMEFAFFSLDIKLIFEQIWEIFFDVWDMIFQWRE